MAPASSRNKEVNNVQVILFIHIFFVLKHSIGGKVRIIRMCLFISF